LSSVDFQVVSGINFSYFYRKRHNTKNFHRERLLSIKYYKAKDYIQVGKKNLGLQKISSPDEVGRPKAGVRSGR
jgi:hypothetical protein